MLLLVFRIKKWIWNTACYNYVLIKFGFLDHFHSVCCTPWRTYKTGYALQVSNHTRVCLQLIQNADMVQFGAEASIHVIISSLSLYLLYYAEACNEFAGLISESLRLRPTQLFSKKYRSGGKPLATLSPIRLTRDLKFRLQLQKRTRYRSTN